MARWQSILLTLLWCKEASAASSYHIRGHEQHVAAATTTANQPIKHDIKSTRSLQDNNQDKVVPPQSKKNPHLIWASSGGGWRAMTADIGYANIFAKLGLILKNESDVSTTLFRSMSANSGGGWFMLQFFYSLEFFRAVVDGTPSSLSTFVTEWMEQYRSIFPNNPAQDPRCDSLTPFVRIAPEIENLIFACDTILTFDSDYAKFVEAMLDAAASNYGSPNLTSTRANGENVIGPLKNVRLSVETALSPDSRGSNNTATTYAGPKLGTTDYLSPIATGSPKPLQWEVLPPSGWDIPIASTEEGINNTDTAATQTGTREGWVPRDAFSSMDAYISRTPSNFSSGNFYEFPPFPLSSFEPKTLLLPLEGLAIENTTFFPPPFEGQSPSVIQIGAATSAAIAQSTSGCPTPFAQQYSWMLYKIENNLNLDHIERAAVVGALNNIVGEIWDSVVTNDISICTEWQGQGDYKGCPTPAGRFMDGWVTDDTTVAMTLGRYQKAHPNVVQSPVSSTGRQGEKPPPVKIILTNNNNYESSQNVVLQYWSTISNDGVPPGGLFWPKESPLVLTSKQIFVEYMTEQDMIDKFVPIEGTNFTTAEFEATTVDNPMYGVRRGTTVRIMLLQINSNIPTKILFRENVEKYTEPLASLAESIAASEVLMERVAAFLSDDMQPLHMSSMSDLD